MRTPFVRVLAGGALLTLMTLVVLAGSRSDEHMIAVPYDSLGSSEARTAMHTLIEDAGSARAYETFLRTYESASFEIRHRAAHLFGESVYEVEGFSGITTCDTSFNFGCYHGFFTAAVSEEGLAIVPTLAQVCGSTNTQNTTACKHGIGHGIIEYVGHDALLEALTVCGITAQSNPLAGCTGGVFMEYNVPLRTRSDGSFFTDARPLIEEEGPYAPCLTLPSKAWVASCLHELPQWWNQVYDGDFTTMGTLCDALPSYEARHVCIAGIGKLVPSSAQYRMDRAEAFCRQLPLSWHDACLMNAAWSLASDEERAADAHALCALATAEKNAECVERL